MDKTLVCVAEVNIYHLHIWLQTDWFTNFYLHRPYIYIYSSTSETEELGIINVSTVRIDYNRALEQMIQVRFPQNEINKKKRVFCV
jgi:hypothetical protein